VKAKFKKGDLVKFHISGVGVILRVNWRPWPRTALVCCTDGRKETLHLNKFITLLAKANK
jgi:hypothetical protein